MHASKGGGGLRSFGACNGTMARGPAGTGPCKSSLGGQAPLEARWQPHPSQYKVDTKKALLRFSWHKVLPGSASAYVGLEAVDGPCSVGGQEGRGAEVAGPALAAVKAGTGVGNDRHCTSEGTAAGRRVRRWRGGVGASALGGEMKGSWRREMKKPTQ